MKNCILFKLTSFHAEEGEAVSGMRYLALICTSSHAELLRHRNRENGCRENEIKFFCLDRLIIQDFYVNLHILISFKYL